MSNHPEDPFTPRLALVKDRAIGVKVPREGREGSVKPLTRGFKKAVKVA
jgi:hypothetical protein